MSILITGMEMPKEGSALVLVIHPDGAITTVTSGKDLPYKAVPVPPHGRLIDADALLKRIAMAKTDQPEIADVYDEEAEEVEAWLSYAPTIIPAEDGEI